jgi:hypothetical protein
MELDGADLITSLLAVSRFPGFPVSRFVRPAAINSRISGSRGALNEPIYAPRGQRRRYRGSGSYVPLVVERDLLIGPAAP